MIDLRKNEVLSWNKYTIIDLPHTSQKREERNKNLFTKMFVLKKKGLISNRVVYKKINMI